MHKPPTRRWSQRLNGPGHRSKTVSEPLSQAWCQRWAIKQETWERCRCLCQGERGTVCTTYCKARVSQFCKVPYTATHHTPGDLPDLHPLCHDATNGSTLLSRWLFDDDNGSSVCHVDPMTSLWYGVFRSGFLLWNSCFGHQLQRGSWCNDLLRRCMFGLSKRECSKWCYGFSAAERFVSNTQNLPISAR